MGNILLINTLDNLHMSPKTSIQEVDNKKFMANSKLAFSNLFEAAKEKNELHYALALAPGFRQSRYNTAMEADVAYEQYSNF